MRDDAVGNQFYHLKGISFGTNVARVDYVISSYGDLCVVFLHLVGFDFRYNLGVGDLFVAYSGDIPLPYYVEGVGAFNTLC